MSKFALVSDLHLDCYRKSVSEAIVSFISACRADYLLIAGDLCEARHLELALFRQWSKFKQIIYIAGNHEHYLTPNAYSIMKAMEQAVPNLVVLKGGHIKLDGIIIAGHTLWHEPQHVLSINDAYYITDYKQFIVKQYSQAQKWLTRLENVQPDIVITHHLPSYACVAEQYKSSLYNAFFVHEGAIERAPDSVKYWLHGHTHEPVNIEYNGIKIIANPHGYAHERAKTNIPYRPFIFKL